MSVTIRYCSYANGSDTFGTGSGQGDGSVAHPYKTKAKCLHPQETGQSDLTGGDEVREEKTPDHTDITGTFTFTHGSPTVSCSQTVSGLVAGDFIAGYTSGTNKTEWWEVSSVSGTNITLVSNYYDPSMLAGNLSGASVKKLGTTDIPPAASSEDIIDQLPVNGTGPGNLRIKVSGGWDFAAEQSSPSAPWTTGNRTGYTWYRIFTPTGGPGNRYGQFYLGGARFYLIENLGMMRFSNGFHLRWQSKGIEINNCYTGSSRFLCSYASTRLLTVTNSKFIGSIQTYNLDVSLVHDLVVESCLVIGSGIALQTISGDCKIKATNASSLLYYDTIAYLRNCKLGSDPQAYESLNGFATYTSTRIQSYQHNNNANTHITFTPQGNIEAADGTTYGHSAGKCWKFTPNTNATADTPLKIKVASFAVNANKQVTAKMWMKKSGTGAGSGSFNVVTYAKGGLLSGVDTDRTAVANNTGDTWTQYTVTPFTPTEQGVIEFWVSVYGSTTAIGWIDDFSIEQAA